ncbi:hypothetical protein [Yoonia sp.]|uniref:hypothetical protein n=1 Tax=Yoonia sp. TaxID=2212373 RepID=UPI003975B996
MESFKDSQTEVTSSAQYAKGKLEKEGRRTFLRGAGLATVGTIAGLAIPFEAAQEVTLLVALEVGERLLRPVRKRVQPRRGRDTFSHHQSFDMPPYNIC